MRIPDGEVVQILLVVAPILLAVIIAGFRLLRYGRDPKNVRSSLQIVLWVTLVVVVYRVFFRVH
jgi:hypothetical protein